MKGIGPCALALAVCGILPLPVQAGFTSLHVFGDGVCSTTNGPGGCFYYGRRFTNGRTWIEVLAQRQGLPMDRVNNWSYFGHYSGDLVTNVNRFVPPPDAATGLFVIWVNDADFVWNVEYYETNLATWTASMDQTLAHYYTALTNLYHAKGARTVVMPNAVDLGHAPYYSGLPSATKRFVRQRILEFNASFRTLLHQTRTSFPDLAVCCPDFFALFDDVLAHPEQHGLANPGIDALSDPTLADKTLHGPGAFYVFWDYLDPTAKVHGIMADCVHQMIAPPTLARLALVQDSNRLDVINLPIGRNGVLDGSTNLASWTALQDVASTHATRSIFVPRTGSRQYYRLRFPPAWSWP
ncbi:MAG: hypothetical protein JXQ71_04445 [Verrucomicrobia bacterium]|nr:hypothetical protein [Verrucomicrobiota bacterium]